MFALPIPAYHNPPSKRRSQYASKKRKRSPSDIFHRRPEPGDNTSDTSASVSAGANLGSSQIPEYAAVITPDERSEFRAAGQPLDEDAPAFPFPHRALGRRPASAVDGQTRRRPVSSARSVSDQPSRPLTLHRAHLGVLMAILHRSMVEKDYVRARRVLGLMLRDQIGGHGLDMRREGVWGMGAATLLHPGARITTAEEARAEASTSRRAHESSKSTSHYTLKALEHVKQYYERLIIQYPFNKNYAGAVSALDFYPAMFALWIYLVQELTSPLLPRRPTPDDSASVGDVAIRGSPRGHRAEHSIAAWEIDQARALSQRMDLCMSTIPFSDDVELIRLRGMVGRWLADLLDHNTPRDRSSDLDSPHSDRPMRQMAGELTSVSLSDHASPDRAIATRLESDRCRRKADEMFQKLDRPAVDTL